VGGGGVRGEGEIQRALSVVDRMCTAVVPPQEGVFGASSKGESPPLWLLFSPERAQYCTALYSMALLQCG